MSKGQRSAFAFLVSFSLYIVMHFLRTHYRHLLLGLTSLLWVFGGCWCYWFNPAAPPPPPRKVAPEYNLDWKPAWSPDGSLIAYLHNRLNAGDSSGIYLVNPNGGQPRLLVRCLTVEHPTWSPDGRKIAFGVDGAIYTITRDGDSLTLLTGRFMNYPNWSPKGNRIIVTGGTGGTPDSSGLWLMDPDGSNKKLLSEAEGGWPTFSPDGAKFVDSYGNGFIIRDTLYNLIRIAPVPTNIGNMFRWSPDGTKFVYRDGYGSIYIINTDGSNARNISGEAFDESPNWSPDGSKIVFDSSPPADSMTHIWIMNADGSGRWQVTF